MPTATLDPAVASRTPPAGHPAAAPHPLVRLAVQIWDRHQTIIAVLATAGILAHLLLRFAIHTSPRTYDLPLWITLALGGTPLVANLTVKLFKREFGSDLLAGISIVTSVLLDEYLAGALVVLMLSGGETLERFAVESASSVLRAMAARMPSIAHRKEGDKLVEVPLSDVSIGDTLLVFPHEICPVDATVTDGHGSMDESYLTGEPFRMPKTPGSTVLSGAINGDSALTIRADKLAVDSRYAKIMQVMRASEQDRPHLRRLGDKLGAYYTPLALAIALIAWLASGNADRFLAVLVVATPCPLLIAIPVAIVGAISLAARRGIIIKRPVILEQVATCRTLIFDKTGTLTYGEPRLSSVSTPPGVDQHEILTLTASLERYSKHPLAGAVLKAAEERNIRLLEVSQISEKPGEGLRGTIDGKSLRITSRKKLAALLPPLPSGEARGISDRPRAGWGEGELNKSSFSPASLDLLPPTTGGLECVVLVNDAYAATLTFRDEPRHEGVAFVNHLAPQHHFDRLMLVSGDRESEVKYLADQVGITEIHAGKTPEEKLQIVRDETARANTLYLGDGINDAPALMAANVGVALGQHSDITTEAAGAVIMDSSLKRVDELFHISSRMRTIALQSAVGGMALSVVGMILACLGILRPVAGAVAQEVIDVFAVLNALRAAIPPKELSDF